jgi:nucleotidyltransferase substrate binding protein (TIGR01987 family)
MERLKERHKLLLKALNTLHISLQKLDNCKMHDEDYEIIRDSVIKRFEYSIDSFWKFLKDFLQHKQGIEAAASPSKVFRQCLDARVLSDQEYIQMLKIIEARNLTSHTYNEALADEISSRIRQYYELMKVIVERIGNETF